MGTFCLFLFVTPLLADKVVLLVDSTTPDSLAVLKIDLTAAATAAGIDSVEPSSIGVTATSGEMLPSQFVPAADFDGKTHIAGTLLCKLPNPFDGRLELNFNKARVADNASPFDGVVRTKECDIVQKQDACGGFPSEILFRKTGKKVERILWLDRLYKKDLGQFQAAGNAQATGNNTVRRISDGPLATIVRVEAVYGKQSDHLDSKPTATYDWMYIKDSPLVYVSADIRQKTAFPWGELHFMELHSKEGELPQWIGGDPQTSGTLEKKNQSHNFANWAAFHDGKNAVGFLNAGTATLYDGKGYGPYLIPRRAVNWARWQETKESRSAWLWIGSSENLPTVLSEANADVPVTTSAVATTKSLLDKIAKLKEEGSRQKQNALLAALLQSTGRIAEAEAAANGHIPASWTLLDAGDLTVVLEKQANGIVLRGILDAKTSEQLAAQKQPPLLELELCAPLTEENAKDYDPETILLGSDTGWSKVDIEPNPDGLEIRLNDPVDERLAGVCATLYAKKRAKENGISWSVDVKNPSKDWALANVRFPQIAIGDFADDLRLLVPHCCGEIEEDPCSRSYRFDRIYPNGWCTMEFEAVYATSKQTGLYWAMHDRLGSTKRIRAISDPATVSVKLGFEHPVPDMRKTGVGFQLPGTAEWRLLRGDWFDAACIYRDWVRKEAVWFPKLGEDGRTDTPQWMKELSVWALMPGDAKAVVPVVKKFQEFMGIPIGVHWYQWHQIPFDNDYPHYFPVKEGFAEGIAELKKSNVYVMPYINGRLWDTHDREAEDWQFTKTALPGATKDEKGAPRTETYRSLETDGKKVALAAMCPSTKIWQDKVAEVIDRLFNEYGVNGVYVDQVAAATPKLCFDASHGHPLGGGSWWNEGYWKMFDRIRAEMPKDRMLTTECNADPFTRWFDGFLSWHWQSNGQVPAFSAVYGGAIQMFGRAYKGGETKELALRMKAGQQLCFGEQIGWINPNVINANANASFFPLRPDEANTPKSSSSEAETSALFFRRVVRVRHAFRRYFYAGEMSRPPKIGEDVPKVTADWQWHKEWVTTPAVLTGAWRLPKEKKTVLFLVNVSDKPVTTTISFDGTEYGFAEFPVQATVHFEDGKTKAVELGKPSFDVTLPPLSAQAWELQ